MSWHQDAIKLNCKVRVEGVHDRSEEQASRRQEMVDGKGIIRRCFCHLSLIFARWLPCSYGTTLDTARRANLKTCEFYCTEPRRVAPEFCCTLGAAYSIVPYSTVLHCTQYCISVGIHGTFSSMKRFTTVHH